MKAHNHLYKTLSIAFFLASTPGLGAEGTDRKPAGERLPTVNGSGPAAQRPSQSDSPVAEPATPEEDNRLTGNWGGLRDKATDHGFDLGVIYHAQWNRTLADTPDLTTLYHGTVDFKLAIDADKLAKAKGLSAFIFVMNEHGRHPSAEMVGDAQGVSNIESPKSETRLHEAWVQQAVLDDRLSLLVGIHDVASEFYVTDAAGLFLNGSFGVGKDLSQTGTAGPSTFPKTYPATRLRYEPIKDNVVQAALFNTEDHQLQIAEVSHSHGKGDANAVYSKYGVGGWRYGGDLLSRGMYVLAEQGITSRLSLFSRYGIATVDVNKYASCFTGGATYAGGITGAPHDRVGFGIARAATSYGTSETTIEGTYRFQLVKGIAFQPDLQWIMHPGADDTLPSIWEGALRMEIEF